MTFYERVFGALNRAHVRYIVVGGVAVVLHGHPRLTADLDLVLDLEEAAARRAIDALTGIGLRPRLPVDASLFTDPQTRRRWIEERNLRVFSLWDPDWPTVEVDLFMEHPMEFDGMWERASDVDLGGTRVRVASIDDLIEMKRNVGRPVDLHDVEVLRELRRGDDDA